jgi:sigma-B regulation protein RsbU (phosphoserine phosphatase)
MINQPFAEDNDQMMFCTFFLGVLDLKTGELSYTNAGHEPPLLINDKVTLLDVTRNLPLGIMADQAYNTQHIMMDKDTTLFIYTDGLTDATNIDNQRFGKERMIKVLDQLKGSNTETLVKGMMRSIDEFVGEADQADDLTMLAIRIK